MTIAAILAISAIAVVDMPDVEAKNSKRTFFSSIMSSDQQPPYENDPDNPWKQSTALAFGKFVLNKHGDKIHYKIFAQDIENVVGIHIHKGPLGVDHHDHLVDPYPTQLDKPIEPNKRGLLLKGTITDDDVLPLCHGGHGGHGGHGECTERTLEDLLDAINNYHAYVNIHTNEPGTETGTNSGPGDLYTPGEIRGQIYPIKAKR